MMNFYFSVPPLLRVNPLSPQTPCLVAIGAPTCSTRELGIAPEYCAVVEDSTPGVAAGIAAGSIVFARETEAVELPAIPGVHRGSSLASIGEHLLTML
jgi:hypothetical protein